MHEIPLPGKGLRCLHCLQNLMCQETYGNKQVRENEIIFEIGYFSSSEKTLMGKLLSRAFLNAITNYVMLEFKDGLVFRCMQLYSGRNTMNDELRKAASKAKFLYYQLNSSTFVKKSILLKKTKHGNISFLSNFCS